MTRLVILTLLYISAVTLAFLSNFYASAGFFGVICLYTWADLVWRGKQSQPITAKDYQ